MVETCGVPRLTAVAHQSPFIVLHRFQNFLVEFLHTAAVVSGDDA
jgi:hypothetical protein